MEFIDGKIKIYENNTYPDYGGVNVMTNSPDYLEQLELFDDVIDDLKQKNTDSKRGGVYENGSGLLGLPGDYTPISRFTKLKTLLWFMPKKVRNLREANYINNRIIGNIVVPLGANPAPTLWYCKFNLSDCSYDITSLFYLGGLPIPKPREFVPREITKKYSIENIDSIDNIAKITPFEEVFVKKNSAKEV